MFLVKHATTKLKYARSSVHPPSSLFASFGTSIFLPHSSLFPIAPPIGHPPDLQSSFDPPRTHSRVVVGVVPSLTSSLEDEFSAAVSARRVSSLFLHFPFSLSLASSAIKAAMLDHAEEHHESSSLVVERSEGTTLAAI